MIRYVTPFARDKNLAGAMNEEMRRAKPGEYVAFMDRDTYFPHPNYGNQIAEAIEENGEGFYTCVTNRTNCPWQRIGAIGDDHYHREVAMQRWREYGTTAIDHTDSQLWSGHLMICPEWAWTDLKIKGLLGVDNEIHRLARQNNYKIFLLPGVYLYHWYSGFDGHGGHAKRDKTHLI